MKCFVIMPFGNLEIDKESSNKLDTIYDKYIRQTVESINLSDGSKMKCHRADKDFRSGEIITHIIDELVNADIVIAVLTGRNPNVFYELGVRHSVKANTILISEDINDIPFDLRHLRIIQYRYTPDGIMDFKDNLTYTIDNIINNPNEKDNPVRKYLFDIETEKIRITPSPQGFDLLKDLIAEIRELKQSLSQQKSYTQQIFQTVLESDILSEISNSKNKIDLDFFTGGWYEPDTGTHLYGVIKNNNLYFPYCYRGDKQLSAHYFKCKLFDKGIIAKFQWFGKHISGYSILEIIDNDTLKGGWLRTENLPSNIEEESSLLFTLPKSSMVNQTWIRRRNYQSPKWVEEYLINY